MLKTWNVNHIVWVSGSFNCIKKCMPFPVPYKDNARYHAMTCTVLWASETFSFIFKQCNWSFDLRKCCYLFLQFLQFARSLRFYGYLQFKPCTTNYPEDDTRVIISVGNRELNFRLQTPGVSVYLIAVTVFLKLTSAPQQSFNFTRKISNLCGLKGPVRLLHNVLFFLQNKIQEGSFKVTRIRCWRITSTVSELLISISIISKAICQGNKITII